MKFIVFSLLVFLNTALVFSNESTKVFYFGVNKAKQQTIEFTFLNNENMLEAESTAIAQPKAQKLKAVLLALFLGHFGVHRIYLGTEANVPVVYSLTLGGGFGLLPLLDIIAILSSKDLSEFSGNSHVIMWAK